MGLQQPIIFAIGFILLQLFASQVVTAPGGNVDEQGHGNDQASSVASSSLDQVDVEFGQTGGNLDLNELKSGVMLAKKELKDRSNALHGLLGNKNDNGKKQMSEPDHLHLVAEARSGQLLHQAVQMQTTLEQLVHTENDIFREMSAKVKEEMNTFAQLYSTLGTIVQQENEPKSIISFGMQMINKIFRYAKDTKSTVFERENNDVVLKAESLHTISQLLADAIINPTLPPIYIENLQSKFNRAMQELAQLITQKPNGFLQLQVAQQVLDRASTLIEAIGANWVEEKEEKGKKRNNKSQQAATWMQNIVREYNAFARKFERLSIGLRPSLYGRFRLADIDRKIEESEKMKKEQLVDGTDMHLVLDAGFWTVIGQLVKLYDQLDLPQMDEIKICSSPVGHISLCIGLIEYDHISTRIGTRRRKCPVHLDEYTLANSKEKATPLTGTAAGLLLVSVARADRVFFAMAQRGYNGHSSNNFTEGNYQSTVFVSNFLCILFGNCLNKEELPGRFQFLSKDYGYSQLLTWRPAFVLPNETSHIEPKRGECVLWQQHYEVRFELDASELKKHQPQMPPLVEYIVGKHRGINDKFLTETFSSQEQMEEIFPAPAAVAHGTMDGKAKRLFMAKLTSYVCKELAGYQKQPYIGLIQVHDQWNGKLQVQTTNSQSSNIDVFDGDVKTMNLAVDRHFRISFVEKRKLPLD